MCFSKFMRPFFKEFIFSFFKLFFVTPPCILRALIVATMITQLGTNPAFLHLMLKNFSAPRSAPNPASVTTKSPNFKAVFVAITELQPCAIFAKGPP